MSQLLSVTISLIIVCRALLKAFSLRVYYIFMLAIVFILRILDILV
jgi:hypothetical protein